MLAVIGGTGLYKIEDFEVLSTTDIQTPFGSPSSPLVRARYNGIELIFLPRHGAHHELLPSEINYRANIWALKSLGATRVLSISAVGSLNKTIKPGNLSLTDQYFDNTRGLRQDTFFGQGMIAHVSMARPTCEALARDILNAAKSLNMKIHKKTTYLCVEGPRFNTRIESLFWQKAGCDIVGMTNIPEAFLAREAQLSYCTLAVITDYDGWLEDVAQHVNAQAVLLMYQKNIIKVVELLKQLLSQPFSPRPDYCAKSLEHAIVTPMANLTKQNQALLKILKQ